MEIKVLHYFITIVRAENITRAAQILHITQPTLSRQIAQLEEELGVSLFVRGNRKIVLTDAGQLLSSRAEEIIELANKTKQEFTKPNQLISGQISIGSGELASTAIFPELFSSFSQKYPDVYYDLYTGNADQILERMDKGLIDIGLLLEPVNIEKYDFIRLDIKERWGVLLRTDAPLATKEYITAKELSTLPIIMVKRRIVQNELASWFGEYFDKLHIFATHNMSKNASELVEAKLGYALVLEGSVSIYDTQKVVFKPLYPTFCTTSILAWKKHQFLSPKVAKFLENTKKIVENKK